MQEREPIIVVSGLPRSGTSLMMQMLSMGGIEPLTDKIREADTDNPKGYFEFERVKKIKEDQDWLPEARGKVVKMISQLLYDLPSTESYKIIFMRRELEEILSSQEKMLKRRGAAVPDREKIKAAFEIHLEKLFRWLPSQASHQLIEINYNGLVAEPNQTSKCWPIFFPRELDVAAMRTAIDSSLYRNREAARSN